MRPAAAELGGHSQVNSLKAEHERLSVQRKKLLAGVPR